MIILSHHTIHGTWNQYPHIRPNSITFYLMKAMLQFVIQLGVDDYFIEMHAVAEV